MKILIVSYSCAPLNIISAQRINALAKYLCARGHSVDILTSVKRPIDGPLDGIRQHCDLMAIADIHEVEFLGRRRAAASQSHRAAGKSEPRHPFLRNALKKARSRLVQVFGALLDYRTLWAFPAVKYYQRVLAHRNYDALITSSGPPVVNYVGKRIKEISPDINWVADFRDLWSLLHSSGVTRFTRFAESALERRLMNGVSSFTTVSAHMAEQLRRLHSAPVHVVRNGFVPSEMAAVVPDKNFFNAHSSEKVNIVYAGSIYPKRRDPFPLIDTIAASNLRHQFALHFFGFSLGDIAAEFNSRGVSDFCFVHPSLPRERILAIQSAADINLLLESGEEDAAGVLTGKLFELAGLRVPVLTIGPREHFESINLLRRTGLLLKWEEFDGNVEAMLAAARAVVADVEFISTLSRDVQFDQMMVSCRLEPARD